VFGHGKVNDSRPCAAAAAAAQEERSLDLSQNLRAGDSAQAGVPVFGRIDIQQDGH